MIMTMLISLMLLFTPHTTFSKINAYGAPSTALSNKAIITLGPTETHTFAIASTVSKNPVHVHYQNEDFIEKLICKKNKEHPELTHNCKLKLHNAIDMEGTFAVFKKVPKKQTGEILFYISMDPNKMEKQ